MSETGFTERYENVVKPFLTSELVAKVRNLNLAPTWMGDEDRFWFKNESRSGHEFLMIDAATGFSAPAFDHQAIARSLTALGLKADPDALDLEIVSIASDGTMRFRLAGKLYAATADHECTETEAPRVDEIMSPDQTKRATIHNFNVQVERLATGEKSLLTSDGSEDFDYGEAGSLDLQMVSRRRLNSEKPISLIWSPDSRYLLAPRTDMRALPLRPYVIEHAPPGEPYAIAHMARHKMPMEEFEATRHLTIIDTDSGTVLEANIASEYLQGFAEIWLRGGLIWWSLATATAFIATSTLDSRRAGLVAINLQDGSSREILTESHMFYSEHNPHDYRRPNHHVTANGRELIWYSNRSGFGHLYLYDVEAGQLKSQITSGDWDVADLVHIDEPNRQIYFAAGGRGTDENPYHLKLYRVSFDGGEIAELTPENSNHLFGYLQFDTLSPGLAQISPSGNYILDIHTTVEQPPVMLLRRIDGSFIAEVARADASALYDTGWSPPDSFVVKAADSKTDLWGVMYKPVDFDPSKKYAIIDNTYPGPQGSFVPHAFLTGTHLATDSQALANLGFIVINIDGRGTTYRGANFRYAFAGTEDVFGAADHKAAVENLAAAHDFIDASRVGIKGLSYGGYGSTRAMLLYPDFYQVNVSYVGPHDFAHLGNPISNERFFWNDDDRNRVREFYRTISNTRIVDRLKGKLFLIWGEIDENVPANNIFIMKQALLDADVDFDSLIVPNNPHVIYHPSVRRREFRYFFDHLGPER